MQARHVWLPQAGASTLCAVAQPADAPAARQERIFIPALPSLEHILIDADGCQHVVLRGNGAAIQLAIEGADITAQPVAITLLIRSLRTLGRASNQLDTLRRILAPARSLGPPLWTTRTENLRDAFITFDGRRAGASHREIAIFLHGARTVTEDWDAGLRERMQRHYNRAAAFSAGGYRRFLR